MKKNNSISLIRLIALIMIISCHILQGLNLEAAFWLNVGVQIFLFMSGYLYGKKHIDDVVPWYKKQFKKIYIPYLVLATIIIGIDVFIFKITYPKTQIITNLIGFQGFANAINTISHTWFISYILLCYLITPLLDIIKIENFKPHQFYIFLILSGSFLFLFEYLHITTLNSSIIFNYILGYAYSKYMDNKTSKTINNFTIILFIVLLAILVPRILMQYNLFGVKTSPYIAYYQTYSHVLLGSFLFIIMLTTFDHLQIKENKLLDFSDKYSYYIYLTHQIFILFHISILHLTNSLFINIILILLTSTITAFILYYFIHPKELFIKLKHSK